MSAGVTLDFSKAVPINSAPQGAQSAQGVTLDFSRAQPIAAGEQINDVGNRVIVPEEGESFADTMNRAAAYGKTVTPQQINAEMATAPRKVAQTLGAAPLIGATGAAGLAAAGAAGPATPQAIAAIKAMAQAHPFAAKLVSRALEGAAASAGGTAAYKWIKDLL
jgi:hypothetical protein